MIIEGRARSAKRAVSMGLLSLALAACTAAGASQVPAPTPPPAAASQPAASGGAAAVLPEGFPIGAWSTTITAEDLAPIAAEMLAEFGMSEEDLVQENTGTFTTTFEPDGSWSSTQESTEPVRWPVFRGTYAPVGAGEMDQTTTFPPDFAGEVIRFTWKVEDGLLHLTVPEPPDPLLGVITGAHPWSPAG